MNLTLMVISGLFNKIYVIWKDQLWNIRNFSKLTNVTNESGQNQQPKYQWIRSFRHISLLVASLTQPDPSYIRYAVYEIKMPIV